MYIGGKIIGETLDDEFHKKSINILKLFERKNPVDLLVISSLNVRLIMFSAHMLPLIPLFTYIKDACCCCNGVKCQGERDTSKVHLDIVEMKKKQPSKLMMKFHPLYHFTKLITRLMFKESYSKRTCK